jgi:endonuclease III
MTAATGVAPRRRLRRGRAVPHPDPAVVERVLRTLAREIDGMELPAMEKISASQQEDPFQILIATLLSARTQDATTLAASTRLFRRARTPRSMAALPVKEIERLIYPVSFYRHKARHVKAACGRLLEAYGGRVPATLDELVTLPGVGRKTATLVLILAFQSRQHICVDTHVHRISNRLGWVRTATPEQTEQALYGATEARWWPTVNLYLVTWGQNVCRPVYPRCGDCAIVADCPRVGVAAVGHSRKGES